MSVYNTILNACKDILDAKTITDLTVVVRKRMTLQDPDEVPIVILSPGNPTIDEEHTENIIVWKRPVWVMVVTAPGDGILDDQSDPLFDLEETVRQALHTPTLSGAPTVFHVDMEPDAIFQSSAVDTGYDMTMFRIDYFSTESRQS